MGKSSGDSQGGIGGGQNTMPGQNWGKINPSGKMPIGPSMGIKDDNPFGKAIPPSSLQPAPQMPGGMTPGGVAPIPAMNNPYMGPSPDVLASILQNMQSRQQFDASQGLQAPQQFLQPSIPQQAMPEMQPNMPQMGGNGIAPSMPPGIMPQVMPQGNMPQQAMSMGNEGVGPSMMQRRRIYGPQNQEGQQAPY